MTPDELHERLTEIATGDRLLVTVVLVLIDIHHPQKSHSINTLSCDEHNVTKPGRIATLSTDDCESCPDCVVTPITVCSGWGCESYPCETIQAVADALQLETARLRPGVRVAYADLPAHYTGTPDGTIVGPTPDEIAYGLTYDPPYRPDQGDVVVWWDGDERVEATWEHPGDLRVLPHAAVTE